MATQPADLHRSLLRPMVIHTLRAAGFHSTKPSVLDVLINLAERHLLLLATTTAQHARSAHNDPVPQLADARHALSENGVLIPYLGAAEEEFRERMRRPLADYAAMKGGRVRMAAEKRRRDDEDTRDVRDFAAWFDGPQYAEIRRVAGMAPEPGLAGAAAAVVGVGGGVVHAEDFLSALKKRHGKGGQEPEARFADTVIGRDGVQGRDIVIEGGPVQRMQDWRPKVVGQEEIGDRVRLLGADVEMGEEDMV